MNLKKEFATSLAINAALLLFGLLLIFFPLQVMNIVSYTLALLLFIVGLYGFYKALIKYDGMVISRFGLVYGVVCVVLAVLLLFKADDIIKILPYTFGVIVVVKSALKLEYVVRLKKCNNPNWKVSLVISLLCLAIGITLLFNPLGSIKFLIEIIGATIVVYSILDFIEVCVIKNNLNDIKEDGIIEATIVKEKKKKS